MHTHTHTFATRQLGFEHGVPPISDDQACTLVVVIAACSEGRPAVRSTLGHGRQRGQRIQVGQGSACRLRGKERLKMRDGKEITSAWACERVLR